MPRDWTESEPPEAASACRALDSCGSRERADEWRSQGVWLNLRGSDSHDTVAESFQWRRRGGGWHAVRAWVRVRLARRWRPQGRESATRRCEVRSLGEGKRCLDVRPPQILVHVEVTALFFFHSFPLCEGVLL